jgi:hypothetical protein
MLSDYDCEVKREFGFMGTMHLCSVVLASTLGRRGVSALIACRGVGQQCPQPPVSDAQDYIQDVHWTYLGVSMI